MRKEYTLDMETTRVFYYTDASIFHDAKTFGGVKMIYDERNNPYIIGRFCYRAMISSCGTDDLELLAIIVSLYDIMNNKYFKASIVTDSTNAYSAIKKVSLGKRNLCLLPDFYYEPKKLNHKLAIYAANIHVNYLSHIDINWDCLDSHIDSGTQWRRMLSNNINYSFADVMNLNQGNLIADDIVSSCSKDKELYNKLPFIDPLRLIGNKQNMVPQYNHQELTLLA